MFTGLIETKRREFMSHVSPEILTLYHRAEPITSEEWKQLRMNSYEQRLLISKVDDDCFIELMQYCMDQAGYTELSPHSVARHYNEAVEREYLPELLRRFKRAKTAANLRVVYSEPE